MGLHSIYVDDEVFAELQKRAIALKDNPNRVLRKVLRIEKPDLLRLEPYQGQVLEAREILKICGYAPGTQFIDTQLGTCGLIEYDGDTRWLVKGKG